MKSWLLVRPHDGLDARLELPGRQVLPELRHVGVQIAALQLAVLRQQPLVQQGLLGGQSLSRIHYQDRKKRRKGESY